jgi:hypothetical protein
MPISSWAGEAVFLTGWIAVGAAAAYSRYKKALERAEGPRAADAFGASREYHNGLYFGRSEILAPGSQPAATNLPATGGIVPETAAASLMSLAQALEGAAQTPQPVEEKVRA